MIIDKEQTIPNRYENPSAHSNDYVDDYNSYNDEEPKPNINRSLSESVGKISYDIVRRFIFDPRKCPGTSADTGFNINWLLNHPFLWPKKTNLTYAIFKKIDGPVWSTYLELIQSFFKGIEYMAPRALSQEESYLFYDIHKLNISSISSRIKDFENDTAIQRVIEELDKKIPFSFTRVSQTGPSDILFFADELPPILGVGGAFFNSALKLWEEEEEKLERINSTFSANLPIVEQFIATGEQRGIILINIDTTHNYTKGTVGINHRDYNNPKRVDGIPRHIIEHELLHAFGLIDIDEVVDCFHNPIPRDFRTPNNTIMTYDFNNDVYPSIGQYDLEAVRFVYNSIENKNKNLPQSQIDNIKREYGFNSSAIILGVIITLGVFLTFFWLCRRRSNVSKQRFSELELRHYENEIDRKIMDQQVTPRVRRERQELGRIFAEYSRGEHDNEILQEEIQYINKLMC